MPITKRRYFGTSVVISAAVSGVLIPCFTIYHRDPPLWLLLGAGALCGFATAWIYRKQLP